jgi:hypothetical protein
MPNIRNIVPKCPLEARKSLFFHAVIAKILNYILNFIP